MSALLRSVAAYPISTYQAEKRQILAMEQQPEPGAIPAIVA